MSLREFLTKMDDYAPIIPDAVTNYYMTKAGLPPPPQTDPRLARLLALATQKFVADIAADAYQYGSVKEIADATVFLFGDTGNNINCHILVVYGGAWRLAGMSGTSNGLNYPEVAMGNFALPKDIVTG
ncbi:Transcription initiation factor TFIID subunit 10 like protein [Verticillium longisporum]|nr:Transcription initiation factor TFIID subunit 10 like protein [Verticillium longisporum]